MLAGAELEGLALASVPRLGQAGLSEHVTLIYMMHGPVGDLRLDSGHHYPLLPCVSPGLSVHQMLEEAKELEEGSKDGK